MSKRKASELSEQALWRRNSNYSDWTIEVLNKESKEVTSFHVHRAVLALGPHASEYFAGLFRANDLKEATEKTTRLEFEGKVVEAFPLLLDYLYTGNLDNSPESFVSLFCLADYFLVESLQLDLRRQIQKKLDEHNIVVFYQDAVALGHDETLSLVANLALQVLEEPETAQTFLQVIDSHYFLRLNTEDSVEAPDRLCEFLSFHREDIDADMFCKLVDHAFDGFIMLIEEMTKLLEVAKDMPKIERFPSVFGKRFAYNLRHEVRDEYATCKSLEIFMEAMDLVKKFPSLDDEVVATLREELVALFVEDGFVFERLNEAQLTCLNEFLPKEEYLKVSVAMLKRCKADGIEVRKLKARHKTEMQAKNCRIERLQNQLDIFM